MYLPLISVILSYTSAGKSTSIMTRQLSVPDLSLAACCLHRGERALLPSFPPAIIMSLSLDTIANFSKATVLHPVTLLAFLGYKAREVNGWPQGSGLACVAYGFLGLYFTKWFSNRWRNGLIPRARLNAETWKDEVVLVTGGAQGGGRRLLDTA